MTFRYYLEPSDSLGGPLSLLNFDNATSTWPMQMVGRLDGENAIKTGETFYFDKMDEWRDSPVI